MIYCRRRTMVTNLFIKGCHRQNLSVIYIYSTKPVWGKNNEQRTISLISIYIVLLENLRAAAHIMCLAKQMCLSRTSYVQESFKDVTFVPHGYLLLDLCQETPDKLRLRSNIFPHEQQVVYIP